MPCALPSTCRSTSKQSVGGRAEMGGGVQLPITDARKFDVRPLFDVIYDY
jgi:hypothetical protein